MAEKLESWVKKTLPILNKNKMDYLSNQYFFRDPPRPTYVDHEYFFSPADGVILYQKIVDPSESIVEIKGKNYTVKEILGDSTYNKRSLVIGIFMTFADVHINRVPYGGILRYERKDPIESTNLPMLALEKDILNKVINPNNMEYLKNNERMVNTIYSPSLDYTYKVVQIADEDVDVISHFTQEQNESYAQNDRFSLIRWGSQCDLVLPLDSRYDFELCLDDHMHIEGGIDKLVKIIFKN
jgi:phosphatidylserine decarboxylase